MSSRIFILIRENVTMSLIFSTKLCRNSERSCGDILKLQENVSGRTGKMISK